MPPLGTACRYPISCSARKMCVPVLEELKFLGHYTGVTCSVHAQLDAMHGTPVDKGPMRGSNYGDEQFLHGYSDATPDHWA